MTFKVGDKVKFKESSSIFADYGIVLFPCSCGHNNCDFYYLDCYDKNNKLIFHQQNISSINFNLFKRNNHPLTKIFSDETRF